MKAKFLSVLMIPALLLVSCKGAKISEDKAKELAKKISENEEKMESKGFDLIVESESASGKGEERTTTDVRFELSRDKADNMKLKAKGVDGEKRYDFVIYTVKNTEYEEISYIKEYDKETKKYTEQVYSKKDNLSYQESISSYSLISLAPAIILAGVMDPLKLMESDDFKPGEIEEDGLTFSHDVTYYSSGERNLTIENKTKLVKGEVPEDNETSIDSKYSITYDNLVIKKARISGKSNYGNNSNITVNLTVTSKSIELPKNWKELLNK